MNDEPTTKFRTVAKCSNCGFLVNPKDEQCEHCKAWFIDDEVIDVKPHPTISIPDTVKPTIAIPKRTDSCETWSRKPDFRNPPKFYSKVRSKRRRKTAKKLYSEERYGIYGRTTKK